MTEPSEPATRAPGLPSDARDPRPTAERDRRIGTVDLTVWRTPVGRSVAVAAHRLGDRFGAWPVLGLTLAIGMVLASVFAWLASEVYEAVLERGDVAVLDRPVLEAVLPLRSPALDAAVTGWTDVGGTIGMPIVAVVFLVVLTVRRRSWTPIVLLVPAAAGSLLMTVAGKQLVGRTRPPHADAVPPYEHSPSFPSGHTLNATVIAGTLVYLLLLRQSTVVARVLTIAGGTVFIVSIGLSRVFLGHHWLTDVLAAWVLGLAWLSLVVTAHRLFLTVVRHRHAGGDVDGQRPATSG
ncbi:phosphatase PAP2 family protein [Curtobacterium sp. RRHDQ10]|uniref:phosphatase PAP2 family protein n=1 Tax=Curtobacterium phyllosphaerae TaxID=3413379 RepID=UPI003BF200AC